MNFSTVAVHHVRHLIAIISDNIGARPGQVTIDSTTNNHFKVEFNKNYITKLYLEKL